MLKLQPQDKHNFHFLTTEQSFWKRTQVLLRAFQKVKTKAVILSINRTIE